MRQYRSKAFSITKKDVNNEHYKDKRSSVVGMRCTSLFLLTAAAGKPFLRLLLYSPFSTRTDSTQTGPTSSVSRQGK